MTSEVQNHPQDSSFLASNKKVINYKWRRLKSYIGWEDYLGFAIFLIGVLGYFVLPIPFFPGLTMVYTEIREELIGIGIVVLIIDNANESIKRREEKKRLILQMKPALKQPKPI